jgi:hypothetical protein
LSLLWSSAAFLKSHRRLAYIFLFVLIIERILFMHRSRNARTKPLFCSIQIYMTGKHRVFLSSKGIVSRDCAHQKMILKGKKEYFVTTEWNFHSVLFIDGQVCLVRLFLRKQTGK